MPLYQQCKVAEAALTSSALESFFSVDKKELNESEMGKENAGKRHTCF